MIFDVISILVTCSYIFNFTVPVNYLIFTQVHNRQNNLEVDRIDIRMISLDISGQFIDVLVPIELHGTETVFVAYDVLNHRVCSHRI